MTGFGAELTQSAQEPPRRKVVRSRGQQRNSRRRCLAGGICPALVQAEVTLNMTTDCSLTSSEVSCTVQVSASADAQDTSLLTLSKSPEYCNAIVENLETASSVDKQTTLQLLRGVTLQLALSKTACRIVQKAFEVASSSVRDLMITELKDHIAELYESPHGNHVLSKAVEVLPAAKIGFVINSLHDRGIAVSKHRFGCRVMCRLIEHCCEEQIGGLLDTVLQEADMLSRHPYGNFVVQTAIEHTSHLRRSDILLQVLPGFASLSTHRTGSLVAQRILSYCDEAGQNAAIHALIQGDCSASFGDIVCNHYGSYVIEQLASMRIGAVHEVANVLARNLQHFQASGHAQRAIGAFGFAPAEPLAPLV